MPTQNAFRLTISPAIQDEAGFSFFGGSLRRQAAASVEADAMRDREDDWIALNKAVILGLAAISLLVWLLAN